MIKINLNEIPRKNSDIETLTRCIDDDLCRLNREMSHDVELTRFLRKLDEKCPCERW